MVNFVYRATVSRNAKPLVCTLPPSPSHVTYNNIKNNSNNNTNTNNNNKTA